MNILSKKISGTASPSQGDIFRLMLKKKKLKHFFNFQSKKLQEKQKMFSLNMVESVSYLTFLLDGKTQSDLFIEVFSCLFSGNLQISDGLIVAGQACSVRPLPAGPFGC